MINDYFVAMETLNIFSYVSDCQAREHRKFAVAEGDHLTMLNVYEAFVKVSESRRECFENVMKFLICHELWQKKKTQTLSLFHSLQHQKSSQWCQEHFLNYKGLLRAMTVREQLRRLLNKFKVPRTSSEGLSPFLIKQKVELFFFLEF